MIELKHIAPYVPHGVKGVFMLSDVIDIHPFMDEKRIKELTADNVGFFLAHCKMILRPLSDLDKDITHDGKIFNPSRVLNTDFTGVSPELLKFAQFNIVQQLIEWHFDIHGLIDKGLAININELNKRK